MALYPIFLLNYVRSQQTNYVVMTLYGRRCDINTSDRRQYYIIPTSRLFFPRGVLDEILNLIESVSEIFPSYSFMCLLGYDHMSFTIGIMEFHIGVLSTSAACFLDTSLTYQYDAIVVTLTYF